MKNVLLLSTWILLPFTMLSQALNWAKATAGTNQQYVNSIAVDQAGNVYSTGEFWGNTDFDPNAGSSVITSQGNADIFVQKYDSNGNLLWAVGIGSTGEDVGTAIDIDQNGNAFITGSFSGTVDFDPSASSYPLTTGGYSDIFVLKLDANGNFVWAKNFKSFVDYSTGKDIKVDVLGNVYTTGKMKGTVDFDPGPANTIISGGSSDIFVHKLTANGDFDWVRTYGGSSQWEEEGQTLEMDDQGDLYVAGIFMSTVDFDAGVGVNNVTSVGNYPNVFVLKLSPNADFVWALGYGSTSNQFPSGADLAINGEDLFVTGNYEGTVDFDPSAGLLNQTSNGSGDIYIEKLDTAGNFQWVRSFGGTGVDRGTSISTDYFGNIYVTGAFAGTVDFDPDPTTAFELVSAGNLDAFVLKLNDMGELDWVHALSDAGAEEGRAIVSDTYGTAIWTAGSFSGTVDFDFSSTTYPLTSQGLADGFIQKLNQTVACIPTFATIEPSICFGEAFISPDGSTSWTQAGSYQDTIANTSGCDSIITIQLSVLPVATGQLTTTICDGDSYTSPSGNYTWSQAGTYTDTLISTNGCDSIVSIDLAITTVDNTVSQQENVLTANQSGASYQWMDCDNNMAIAGATNATFTALVNGNYAVQISLQNCTVVSNCVEVSTIGIDELNQEAIALVYPNPTANAITVEVLAAGRCRVDIFTITGNLVLTTFVEGQSIVQLPEEDGVYMVQLTSEKAQHITRIVKYN